MRVRQRGLLVVMVVAGGRQSLMLARTMRSRLWMRSQVESSYESGRIVLIPAYREEAVAAASAEYFRRISQRDQIVFVTSSAELPPLTAQALDGSGVDVWVCPSPDPCKASLLNYAARRMGPGRVMLVYDVDSRPQQLAASPSSKRTIRQQLIFYEPSSVGSSWFWGMAARQSRWTLAYEAVARRDGRLAYAVGHGLAVFSDLVLDVSFAEGQPGEDIDFGYRSFRHGARFEVDPAIDVADAPATLIEFLEQNGRWFLGEVVALSAQSSRHLDMPVARRIGGVAHWMLRPVFAVAIATAATAGSRGTRLIGLGLLVADIAGFVSVVREYRRLELETPSTAGALLAAYAGYSAQPIVAGVSAWRALCRYGPGARRNGGPRKADHHQVSA